jgi:hypothetical protein
MARGNVDEADGADVGTGVGHLHLRRGRTAGGGYDREAAAGALGSP